MGGISCINHGLDVILTDYLAELKLQHYVLIHGVPGLAKMHSCYASWNIELNIDYTNRQTFRLVRCYPLYKLFLKKSLKRIPRKGSEQYSGPATIVSSLHGAKIDLEYEKETLL